MTESGALKDTRDPEHIPWAPTRLSGWVTVARLVKGEMKLELLIYSALSLLFSLCVCVCVCERERERGDSCIIRVPDLH